MIRTNLANAIFLLAATACFGQTAPAPAAPGASSAQQSNALQVIGHGAFPLVVNKPLESNKLKAGDTLDLPTAADFILPNGTRVTKGSKISAHVLRSASRSKGDAESALVIQFDSIHLAGGNVQPVKGFIQAVGQNLDTSGPIDPLRESAGSTSGTPMATSGGTTGINTGASGPPKVEMLNAQSTGVHGIKNLELSADGVLTSNGKNVKLAEGYQLIVRVDLLQP